MKSTDDKINDQLEQREQHTEEKQKQRAAGMRVLIPVCIACCVALIGFGVWKSGWLRKNPGTNNTTGQTTVTPGETDNMPTPTEPNNTTPTPTEPIITPTPTEIPLVLEKSQELSAGSSGSPAQTKKMDDTMREAYETFAYKLFAQLPAGETRMISPFSVYVALSMLADGADGDTLAQLDELLGLTAEERNAYLAEWLRKLDAIRDTGETSFTNADSLWINEDLKSNVPKDYLDICAQYFKAAVFSAPMDDSTVKDVNAWVKSKTKNMIDEIMNEMPPNVAMILMNAIALDAKWEVEFEEERIWKENFTKEDGATKEIDMMYGEQKCGYLENDLATGFIKPYTGGEFSYIALLPNRDVSLDQLIAWLSPENVRSLMNYVHFQSTKINIGIPKYKAEYSIEFSDVLKQLGVTDAFDDGKANLSRMIKDPSVYVGEVDHKTFISVDEKGTEAAAVTEVVIQWKSMTPTVILDHPFVYMIVDSDGLPIFIGTYEG